MRKQKKSKAWFAGFEAGKKQVNTNVSCSEGDKKTWLLEFPQFKAGFIAGLRAEV